MKLTKDEREILTSYSKGEWVGVKDLDAQRKNLRRYAKSALRKDRRVNIRITENDLLELQRKAVQEGLPYQTLIASILHKYINGRYVERSADSV
jgi:predicted DNA binding CopG/RHH family protein